MIFSAINVDVSSLDLPGSIWRLAHAGVKERHPSKKWLFYRYRLV